jgi:hypothetical protein
MKTIIRTAAVVAFLSLAASCGGQGDEISSSDDSKSTFDPINSYVQVKSLAAKYTKSPMALSLSATRQASASSSSSSCSSFTWVWTVVGQNGIFVDVQVSSSGAKVTAHEQRFLFAGESTFDPSKLTVTGNDALQIAAQQKQGQPTDLYLGKDLAVQGEATPRWNIGFSKSDVSVDAVSGDLIK